MIKFLICFYLQLFLSSGHASVPLDVVFDIDQTIVTLIHAGPGGDYLADPLNPHKGTITISHTDAPKPERYRVYDGLTELMQRLKTLQDEGKIRVSFFSGGTHVRNSTLLENIVLPDGSNLKQLAGERVFSREHMTPTGKGSRIREKFKKDLTKVNPDLTDVILIDDIKEFVPETQLAHVLWLDEAFPYPERYRNSAPPIPTPEEMFREKNKFQWISSYLLDAIDLRFKIQKPLSTLIDEKTSGRKKTPFTQGEEFHFQRGQEFLKTAAGCSSQDIYRSLQLLHAP